MTRLSKIIEISINVFIFGKTYVKLKLQIPFKNA